MMAVPELGQWLHGSGRTALGHYPAFDMLLRRHRYFHQQAAALITHAEAGDILMASRPQGLPACIAPGGVAAQELQRPAAHAPAGAWSIKFDVSGCLQDCLVSVLQLFY